MIPGFPYYGGTNPMLRIPETRESAIAIPIYNPIISDIPTADDGRFRARSKQRAGDSSPELRAESLRQAKT